MKWIQTISEYFEIDPDKLEEQWVFNRVLWVDSKLFVDPFLIDSLWIDEFKDAKNKLKERFRKIIKLLSTNNQMAFNQAVKLFISKETRGVWIWYWSNTDNWSSIWPELALKLAKLWKEIVDLWINDPEIFELLWLFQEDFWPDRISDFTIDTLKDDFIFFTQRVAKELWIKKIKKFTYKGTEIFLPFISERNTHVIFLPKKALRDLPIALDRSNVHYVVMYNNELRDKLNQMVWDDWKDYIENKDNRKKEFLEDKNYIEQLFSYYKSRQKLSYDYTNDPNWEFDWRDKWFKIANDYPLSLNLTTNPNIDDIKQIVRNIIAQFKQCIEHNWLNELLKKWNWRFSERYAQKIFFAVASSYCEANNLDISPESKSSTGPIDFKFSNWLLKVLIETKLTSNDINSWILQLQEYEKWEWAIWNWIYLIIRTFDQHDTKLEKFIELWEDFKDKWEYFPEYYIIDGRIKPTPSNLKLKV